MCIKIVRAPIVGISNFKNIYGRSISLGIVSSG